MRPGERATDADRRRQLLTDLAAHPRPWIARFFWCGGDYRSCWGKLPHEGICPGEIIPEERGDFGFGYDPIFYLPDQARTMAELPLSEKNTLSHRARRS